MPWPARGCAGCLVWRHARWLGRGCPPWQEHRRSPMSDLMGKRNWFFALSALIIVPGLVSLIVFHLRLGIDFTGGSLLQYRFTQQVQSADVKAVYASAGIPDVEVQTTVDGQTAIIRAPNLAVEQIEESEGALRAKYAGVTREAADTVGPLIGQQTTRNAVLAVLAASAIILLYI